MKIIKLFFLMLSISFFSIAFGQDYLKRFKEIDVQSYYLAIGLHEKFNKIEVEETVEILFLEKVNSFHLDLVGRFEDSLGMKISSIAIRTNPVLTGEFPKYQEVKFKQEADKVILFPDSIEKGEKLIFVLKFEGIPTDGLIIGKNKFGDRTFFADNWPMRAKHWFACVDHPSDKAIVDLRFVFDEISNTNYKGVGVGREGLGNCVYFGPIESGISGQEIYYVDNCFSFHSDVPIPTKVIVFGFANFEKQTLPRKKNQVEITNFVYPQDKEKGFKDFEQADTILAYFEAHIGKFPFEKLYNVQSTTRYGGMENAGCIFYDEKAITGKGKINELIAHEIVHQWFGNSASELDWPHLWLSEGFATYLTDLYIEDHRGEEAFLNQLRKQREAVIRFYAKNKLPLKDTISTNTEAMLNTNAYQKGAWILHMLREQVGKELFWKAIATYYDTYKFSNATSIDFIRVFEQVSKQNLSEFYQEWICQAGHPIISTVFSSDGKQASLTINQNQTALFHFPIEINIQYEDNTSENKTFCIKEKQSQFTWETSKKIKAIKLDPNVRLLFEEK